MKSIGDKVTIGNEIGKIIAIIPGKDQFGQATYHYRIHYTERIVDRYRMQTKRIDKIKNCNKSFVG